MKSLGIASFCIFSGAISGGLAALVLVPVDVAGEPFGTLFLSVMFGAVVGLLCMPFTVLSLNWRDTRGALLPILAILAPVVFVLSVALNPNWLFTIMTASGGTFVVAAFAVSRFLPRVYMKPGGCERCGYDLRGSLDAARCPECGTPFDPASLKIDDQRAPRSALADRRPAVTGLLWILVLGPFLLGIGRSVSAASRMAPTTFDAAAWRAGDEAARARMVNDLCARGTLIGLREAEVLTLLGPPDYRHEPIRYEFGQFGYLVGFLDSVGRILRIDGKIPKAVPDESFDLTCWREGTDAARATMARALLTIRGGRLDGKPIDEVVELLGAPDHHSLKYDYDCSVSARKSGSLLSTRWVFGLTLEFKDARVATAKVYAD